jgi:hypothetical protein
MTEIFYHFQKPSTWIATLTINQVTESDAGQYLCISQNEYGRETAIINLKVEEHKVTNRNSSRKSLINMLTNYLFIKKWI